MAFWLKADDQFAKTNCSPSVAASFFEVRQLIIVNECSTLLGSS